MNFYCGVWRTGSSGGIVWGNQDSENNLAGANFLFASFLQPTIWNFLFVSFFNAKKYVNFLSCSLRNFWYFWLSFEASYLWGQLLAGYKCCLKYSPVQKYCLHYQGNSRIFQQLIRFHKNRCVLDCGPKCKLMGLCWSRNSQHMMTCRPLFLMRNCRAHAPGVRNNFNEIIPWKSTFLTCWKGE